MNDIPLECIEFNPEEPTRCCVIWLHGLGADGNDFVPIMRELALPDALGIRFVFPHAPVIPVTINGGYRMRAWYDVIHTDLTQRADQAGVESSVAAVSALVEREINAGVPRENILLAGFSQGGVIALHAVLRARESVAGLVVLSTYLPLSGVLSERPFTLPVFWGHGRFDPLIPLQAGEAGRAWLEAQGHPVEWHVYPMEHAVCQEEIEDIRRWILGCLDQ